MVTDSVRDNDNNNNMAPSERAAPVQEEGSDLNLDCQTFSKSRLTARNCWFQKKHQADKVRNARCKDSETLTREVAKEKMMGDDRSEEEEG